MNATAGIGRSSRDFYTDVRHIYAERMQGEGMCGAYPTGHHGAGRAAGRGKRSPVRL